jgi:hypothetical protein
MNQSPINTTYSGSDDEAVQRIFSVVSARIEHARVRQNRIRAAIHGLLIIATAVAFVPAIAYLVQGATQSGFIQYASLISDGASVAANWKEIVWSLADAMPVLEIAGVLALLLIFINSLYYELRYLPRIRSGRSHARA